MSNYTVKSIAVSGVNNKVYTHGEAVSDKCFPVGHAEDLLKRGHLVLTKNAEKALKSAKNKAIKEAQADFTEKKNTYLGLTADFENIDTPTKTLNDCQLDIDNAQIAVTEAKEAKLTVVGVQTVAQATLDSNTDEAKKEDFESKVTTATGEVTKATEKLGDSEKNLVEAAEALTSFTNATQIYTDLQREVRASEIEFNKAKVYLEKLTK